MYRKKRDFMVYKTRTFLLCHLGHSERERERESTSRFYITQKYLSQIKP